MLLKRKPNERRVREEINEKTSDAEASQSNETMIRTLGNFDDVTSFRGREVVLIDAAEN